MFKKFWDIVEWVILVALIVCTVATLVSVFNAREKGEQAFVFGYRPVYVMTGSMEPTMRERSIVWTKEVTSMDDIEVGDVVSYHIEDSTGRMLRVTHRIIDIDENGMMTMQGDNNNVCDAYKISIDNVEAKAVWTWNWVASVINRWNSGWDGKIVVLAPIVFVICLYLLIQHLLADKKEKEIIKETIIIKEVEKGSTDNKSLEDIFNETKDEVKEIEDIKDENK